MLPAGPAVGVIPRCGTTVNVAVAVFPEASFPVNTWPPYVVGGKVKGGQLNDPVELVVRLHTVPPLHDTVVAEVGANPLPVKVIDVPVGPAEGEADITGVTPVFSLGPRTDAGALSWVSTEETPTNRDAPTIARVTVTTQAALGCPTRRNIEPPGAAAQRST